MSEMNRRSFVAGATAAVSLVVLGDQFTWGQAATPPGPASAPSGNPTVDIGKPSDFGKDSISTKFSAEKVLIVSKGDKIYALTAVCTHRGSTINATADGKFRCPSHNSLYDMDGKPAGGPTRVALKRHAISLNGDGHLIVDKTKLFEEPQWSDPAASYTIKA
jgi:Rieske Fe-S protein